MRKSEVSRFIREEIDIRTARAYNQEGQDKFITTVELDLYKNLYALMRSSREDIIKTIQKETDSRRILIDQLGGEEKEKELKANLEIIIYKNVYQKLVGR